MCPNIDQKSSTKSFEHITVERHIKEAGLHCDVLASWSSIHAALQLKKMGLARGVITYQEHIQKKADEFRDRVPDFYEKVMEKSKPEAVTAYNELVLEFNSSLPRIKQTENFDALRYYYKEMYKLLYGTELEIEL